MGLRTLANRIALIGVERDRDYFIENMGVLIASGMPILEAIDGIVEEIRSRTVRNIIASIRADIESGVAFSESLEHSGVFSRHAISLIRIGEASGRLTENLKIVAEEQERERALTAKLRSAMMYPVFVLVLTLTIGIGIAWFILPKLATIFTQIDVELPLITRLLISAGTFLSAYGIYVIPLFALFLFLIFSVLFLIPGTKRAGESLLLWLPGVGRLVREVELARFGYLLGTLLGAGVPIVMSLDSLAASSSFTAYRRLFTHLARSVDDGFSFHESFTRYPQTRKLMPAPVVQLIAAAERSGTLAEAFRKIGQQYDERTENTTKDLTVMLEPILLVIVWLGVVGVAIAVILPIYSLQGSLNQGQPTEREVSAEEGMAVMVEEAVPVLQPYVRVQEEGIEFLNVRSEPSEESEITTTLAPGSTHPYLSREGDWYQVASCNTENACTSIGWAASLYLREVDP